MKQSPPIEEAFLDMITSYQGIIHKVCLIYFKDKETRKETFQEILYQLWKSYPGLKNRNSVGSWIYRVAINTAVTRIRQDIRLSFRESLPDSVAEDHFLSEMETNEAIVLLHQAINHLSEIEKALVMLYLEEKAYDEIAGIMGMTKSNVGVKLMRIKEKLKGYLTD